MSRRVFASRLDDPTARDQLRRETEEILRAGIRDDWWEYACREGWIDDDAMGAAWELAKMFRRLPPGAGALVVRESPAPAGQMLPRTEGRAPQEKERAPRKAPAGRRADGPSPRTLALSHILGRLANMEEEVVAFRTDDLGGELLQPDQVEAWLKDRQAKDGEPTVWVTVPAPPSVQFRRSRGYMVPDPPITVDEEHPPMECRVRTLAYGVPEDPWVRHLPTTFGGTLEFLRLLSESLSQKFGWWEAQATVFVLTGMTPLVSPTSARVQHNFHFPAATRIHLTVDPTLAPREVAEAFRRVRVSVLGDRHRDLSEKHLALAEFASEHPAGLPDERMAPGASKARMAAWNAEIGEEHPDWTYEEGQERMFARDCAAALRRLLDLPYRFDQGGTP